VWSRFGDVDNYVEPFMGSLAVLLRRPAGHFANRYRVETANDLNHYIVNFWRAVAADPDEVGRYADNPVTEADLCARHTWLVRSREAAEFREKMRTDPHHHDAKIAGWWVWGACCWIAGAWCATHDSRGDTGAVAGGRPQLADTYDIGRGVNAGGGLKQKRPDLNEAAVGVNAGGGLWVQRPQLLVANGVVSGGPAAVPQMSICDVRRAWLVDWMRRLADRLRLVRTCYGHWSRVCDSDSTVTRLGLTGVFLDPPYPANRSDTGAKSRSASLYATDKGADLDALRDEVLDWCRRWGPERLVRVAVCCYEGDGYEPLVADGWTMEAWEASGGYANQRQAGKGKSENARRERILFSPHCLKPDNGRSLFDGLADDES